MCFYMVNLHKPEGGMIWANHPSATVRD
jgi:hypothetical protein